METPAFIPLAWTETDSAEMTKLAESNYALVSTRRTTRHFSTKSVNKRLIELAILSGSTAPNGAHLQPWTWMAISSQELKQKIRDAAEAEEQKTYEERMPDAWSEVLAPLGTDAVKAHLTDAPWIVVLFKQKSGCVQTVNGGRPITQQSHVASPQVCSFKPFTIWVWSL